MGSIPASRTSITKRLTFKRRKPFSFGATHGALSLATLHICIEFKINLSSIRQLQNKPDYNQAARSEPGPTRFLHDAGLAPEPEIHPDLLNFMQNTVLTNINVSPTPGKFSVVLRVYNQDIDAGRMVYVGNYMNFLERARTEWFHHLGLSQRYVERHYRAFFVARDLHLDCFRPAYLDDVLKVSIGVKSLGRTKMVWAHTIERDGIIASADLTAVWVDLKTLKPVAMPAEVREKFLAEFEQRAPDAQREPESASA